MSTDERFVVNAAPTKELFIEMLTKDIGITRAILDLVDNSVDGARRRNPDDFQGLSVALTLNANQFKIVDNCGGMSPDVARTYAFRFGRPSGTAQTPHSVGQFGVGMKRALFKLGRCFHVSSITTSSMFELSVDVEAWKAAPDDWTFTLDSVEEDTATIAFGDTGTTITVTELLDEWQQQFESPGFLARLKLEIEQAHIDSMRRGLSISVNAYPLTLRILELLQSPSIRPAVREFDISVAEDRPSIRINLYAGISESNPREAGWYVFCNARLILNADQSSLTGWGADSEQAIPKYHNQFARFRGYAFCDSVDASLLPWNTTKTGVDSDSLVYQRLLQSIISVTRPVIDFLNALDAEKGTDDPVLSPIVADAVPTRIAEVSGSSVFEVRVATAAPQAPRPDPTISYRRDRERVNAVRAALGVKSNREVGERTFDYFYDLECGD
ncbi:MAG: ATP-binding protein [Thermoanaerobaculia bacterium]